MIGVQSELRLLYQVYRNRYYKYYDPGEANGQHIQLQTLL